MSIHDRLVKFTQNKSILIADSNPTTRNSIIIFLKQLGVKADKISSVNNFIAAAKEIEKKQPEIIICDYELGSQCGLDLISSKKPSKSNQKDNLFIMITGNTSQRAVARAAEEDVDCYVLKPFSTRLLSESMSRAVAFKTDPHPYLDAIEQGKAMIVSGDYEEASRWFLLARERMSQPALACYYQGQLEMRKKEFSKAEAFFREGLGYNKIHFKCLTGFFDSLVQQARYDDAYGVIKKISYYYPANSQRLASVLRLAILTQSYSDVERYYRLFTQVKDKNSELIKYISAALVVCGRYYLQKNIRTRAIELFNHALNASQKNAKIVKEIIMALIEFKLDNSAEAYMAQLSSDYRITPEYQALMYLFEDRKIGKAESISRGETLIRKGVDDPLIYEVLIQRLVEDGHTPRAQELAQIAGQKWPELKAKLAKFAQGGK
jgi:DNA-binding response OmpR family regulator